jgi:prepilin-type N-terminal cleavage/methylation domain-containing protein
MIRRAVRSRLAREERGFTLIELLIAMLVTAVGVIAIVGTFDYSRRLTTTAEKNEVAAHYAESEMERILALDYKTIALPTAPASSTDASNPDYYVNGSSYRWDQGTPGQSDPLVVDPANAALTHVSTWSDGQTRLSGSIYRYVTSVAGSGGNARRVTLAITVNGKGLTKPVIVSSIATDPKAGTG